MGIWTKSEVSNFFLAKEPFLLNEAHVKIPAAKQIKVKLSWLKSEYDPFTILFLLS